MQGSAKKLRLLFSYLLGHKRQVTAAVIEKDGKVLIAKRKRVSTLGGKWEFPGGKVEPWETPEDCLRRELKEELDIESRVTGLFASSIFRYCFIPIVLLAYRVEHISGNFKVCDHEEIRWVKISELDNYDFTSPDKPIVALLQKS